VGHRAPHKKTLDVLCNGPRSTGFGCTFHVGFEVLSVTSIECPKCGLLSPPASNRCDCGYIFISRSFEPRGGSRNLVFRSTVKQAAGAIFQALILTAPLITAAWAYARFYRWFFDCLNVSDGVTSRFEGDPLDIYMPAACVGSLPVLEPYFNRIVLARVLNEGERFAVALLLLLVVNGASALMWMYLYRWMIAGIRLSSGTTLEFDGHASAVLGWLILTRFVLAMGNKTAGAGFLAIPFVAVGWLKWFVRHVHGSGGRRLHFRGSFGESWWRCLVAAGMSAPLITIPWVLIWFYAWLADRIVVVPEGGQIA
jgi:hypothetical protein